MRDAGATKVRVSAVHTQVNLLGQPGTILKHRKSCLPRTQLAPEAVQRPPYQETKATGKDAVGNQRPSWRLVQTQTQKKQQHTCHAAKNNVCDLIQECTSGSGQIAACWKAERHHIHTEGSGEREKEQHNISDRRWSCERQKRVPLRTSL